MLMAYAMRVAWNGARPMTGSIYSLMIFSGVSAATFSISTPPSSEPIMTILAVARSTTKLR